MKQFPSVIRITGMSATDAAADLPATPLPDQLPDDPATLKSMILELLETLQQERRDHEAVRHRLDLLLRRLYGPRGERFDPNQALLFVELAEGQSQSPGQDAAPAGPAAKPKRRCKPHGRRRLPEHLPREPRHHQLPEAARVCPGCGQVRIDIGVDKSEQLEYRPASLFVIEHFVHKYACPCCSKSPPLQGPALPQGHESDPAHPLEPPAMPAPTPHDPGQAPPPRETGAAPAPLGQEPTAHADAASPPAPPPPPAPPAGVVVAAPKPAMPIAKGLPGPGLLAHLIVSKYVDHLPLHRLERVYERQGLVLPRSTTCDWLAACAQLLRPLYELMIAVVLESRVIHTDDTPVKIHDPPPGLTELGRLWAYLGDPAHAYNVFDFTPNRKRDGPQRFLANFRGYLQADAFSGYDRLYLPSARAGVARIIEVACNAHARRKFYEARSSDALRSHQALAYYGQLYELERRARANHFDEGQLLRMRQDLAVPIFEQFRTWLDAQRAEVLPKSPMGEAITYALNQWTALVRYTEAGFLAIDNNVAEREMKRIAIGRKNWLFVGSEQGGHTAAVLFSFTSTCQRLGVEPWAYLRDVLTRLPTTPPGQLADLLPDRWQAARQAEAATASPPAAATSPPPPSGESAS
jgi:transposase